MSDGPALASPCETRRRQLRRAAAFPPQHRHDLVGKRVHLFLLFFPGEAGTAEHHATWKVRILSNLLDAENALDQLFNTATQARAKVRGSATIRPIHGGRVEPAQVGPQVPAGELEFLRAADTMVS